MSPRTQSPSAAAMRAAEEIDTLHVRPETSAEEFHRLVAEVIDSKFAPLPDAEREELVRQIDHMIRDGAGYGWLKRCKAALSRPAPGWNEACEKFIRECTMTAEFGASGLDGCEKRAWRKGIEDAAAIARGMKKEPGNV